MFSDSGIYGLQDLAEEGVDGPIEIARTLYRSTVKGRRLGKSLYLQLRVSHVK